MMRWFACLCLCLLAACGGPSRDTSPRPSAPIGPMVIGDRDPVAFNAPRPQSFAVKGTDVARFQSYVDWPRARTVGIRFAFIKATEGGDLLDPMFRDHWRGAAQAGIARGAYHFYYFCTPPEVQARWFIRNVPRTRGALPPVLDMEWNPLSPSCQRRPDGATVRAEMQVWLDLVERHYGQRPVIYTTPGFYEDTGLSRLRGEDFWLRTTAKTPREAYPGQRWRFWQYTATGSLPGTPGNIDLNVFNGSLEDWNMWLARRAQ